TQRDRGLPKRPRCRRHRNPQPATFRPVTVGRLTGQVAPWRRGYDRSWLSRDIIAGLAAGAVVIPQAMAYATVANLPVQVALYTCMVPMAVYALVGGSRTLSVST